MRADFTLRQLQYIAAVSESGSIAAAAAKLRVSAPTISAAITQLEDIFELQIFVRKQARGVSLTPGGARFLKEIEHILTRAERLYTVAADIGQRVAGTLNVGCLQTLAPILLPDLRKRFQRAYPDVEIRQVEDHQAALLAGLEDSVLDACLTYNLDIPRHLHFQALRLLPAYVMLPAAHPLATRAALTLRELQDEPLILLDLPLSGKYFLSIFAQAGLRPAIAEKSKDMTLVRSLVANGFGYSLGNIRPKTGLSPDGKALACVPLRAKAPPLYIGLATIKTNHKTRLLECFYEHCRTCVDDYAKDIEGAAAPPLELEG